jgi:hypothetical protein
MSKFLNKFLALAILVTFAGCAVAPINSTTTARTLGEGQNEVRVNVIIPGAMVQRGLTNNLDLGLGVELQFTTLVNLFAKYAFINKPAGGFSLAALGGVGVAGGSKSAYAGPILSYRHNWFEAFTIARYNYVRWSNDVSNKDRDDLLNFIPSKIKFGYTQLDVGASYLTETAIVSGGAKIFSIEKDSASVTPFFDIGFKF